jgi:hypothetical protein
VEPAEVARALRRAASGAVPLWIDATGDSMRPLLIPGDRVQVVAADRPRWGEVWAFCDGSGAVVVHRYLHANPRGHVFQGDAVVRTDAAVPTEQLIGRVAAVDRQGTRHPLGPLDRWRRGLLRQATYYARGGARRLRRLVPKRS